MMQRKTIDRLIINAPYEETAGPELLRVSPVLKQPFRDACDARIPGLAPCPHAGTYLVDQGDFNEDAGIVEGLGTFGGNQITRFAALTLDRGIESLKLIGLE